MDRYDVIVIGDALAERLAAEGVELLVGVEIARVGLRDGGAREVLVDVAGERRTLTGDAILLGTGRAPALEPLRPEHAGAELSRHGLRVDRTLAAGQGVVAAGDVVGDPYGAFTHVARRMGGVAGANAVDGGSRELDPDIGPRAIFTDPEVATIGLTEAAARAAGHEVSVRVERFAGGKARAWGEEHGLAKVVCEAGSDRILGAAVLAYHAADLIHPVAVAMPGSGGSARPLIDAYHVHPTMGEVVQRAARGAVG